MVVEDELELELVLEDELGGASVVVVGEDACVVVVLGLIESVVDELLGAADVAADAVEAVDTAPFK